METVSSLIERIDAEFSAAEKRLDQLRVATSPRVSGSTKTT